MSPPRSSTPPAQRLSLVVVTGSQVGRRFDIGHFAVLGRSEEADVLLEDAEVSRLHARLEWVGADEYELEDLGSSNGTSVNGVRVKKTRIKVHDRIGLGGRLTLILARRESDSFRSPPRRQARTIDGDTSLPQLVTEALVAVKLARSLPPSAVEQRDEVLATAQKFLEQAGQCVDAEQHEEAPPSGCNVSGVCEAVLERVERALPREVRVHHDIDELLHGAVDEAGLREVLTLLCVDARDTLFDRGRLHMAARARGSSQVSINLACSGGDGFDDHRPRTFPSQSALERARAWVEQFGGEVITERSRGGGGRVELRLPGRGPNQPARGRLATEHEHEAVRHEASGSRTDDNAPTILVVDDEHGVRRSVGRILERAGYKVRHAADGQEALDVYGSGSTRPNLVLMDLNMPNMSGAEALEKLRGLDRDARVVVASGELDDDGEDKFREAGAVGTLRKPFASSSLVESVRRALREQPTDPRSRATPPDSPSMEPPIRRPTQRPRAYEARNYEDRTGNLFSRR